MENNCCYLFYLLQPEKIPKDLFDKLLAQLPENFQAEINQYKHWQSAQASLFGKIVLQYAFKELELPFTLHAIKIGAKDKPFLDGEIDFNISHSGDAIVVGIIQQAKTGVDVEKHRTINLPLFKKYFDEEEWNFIENSNDALKAFFDYWTIKESAIKHDGRGVEILSKTKIRTTKIYCDNNELYYKQLKIHDNYSCAVCSEIDFEIKTQNVSLEEISFVK